MSRFPENVDLIIRGEGPFEVSGKKLANFTRGLNSLARDMGKRPGEPIKSKPFDGLSADAKAASETVLDTLQKRLA
jgi:hypothetical protein